MHPHIAHAHNTHTHHARTRVPLASAHRKKLTPAVASNLHTALKSRALLRENAAADFGIELSLLLNKQKVMEGMGDGEGFGRGGGGRGEVARLRWMRGRGRGRRVFIL